MRNERIKSEKSYGKQIQYNKKATWSSATNNILQNFECEF